VTADNALRKVVLNGPFYSASKRSTFTLVLDKYGENVSITPPPSPG
jgi:lipoprotein LprG